MEKRTTYRLPYLSWSVLVIAFVLGNAAEASESQESGLAGTVQAEDGSRISGATVSVSGNGLAGASVTTSDADGSFRVPNLLPGTYAIAVRHTAYLPLSEQVTLGHGETGRVEVVLSPDITQKLHERVMVVGGPEAVGTIPGSAVYLDTSDLNRQQVAFGDIHRHLRRVPGVYIQEEEGFGLRPNIGMRGAATERSSNITVMEDGVLAAPAPYAAPAAYYFPVTARMKGIEVRKGSSQIKYGPRTHGGALNLISTPIPDNLSLSGDLIFGSFGTRNLYATLGDSYSHFGWVAETFQITTNGFKELDTGGDTGFDIEDYLVKFRLNTDPRSHRYQHLEFKFGRTSQDSDETYLGLTEADFRANSRRRYAASQEDRFHSDFRQLQARHFLLLSSNLDLTTVLYRNDFSRNWYKLQSVLGRGLAGILSAPDTYPVELGVLRGADSEAHALTARANNREYYAHGVQSVLGMRLAPGTTRHLFEVGLRYHEDQEDRFQHDDRYQMQNSRMLLTQQGAPGSQDNRIGDARAWAFFIQDRIEWRKWTLVPGIRYENIELTRTDYSRTDPSRTTPTAVRANLVDVWVPGIGVHYAVTPVVGLFGGVHRGFAPPGPGSTEETDAERSVNYEFGTRWTARTFRTELVGFYNRYSNLLGRDTLSSGGAGTGDLFNGGAARIRGFEASFDYDFREALPISFGLPVRLAYTLTDGEFRNSFQSSFAPWGNVVIGDELPYLPGQQLFLAVGVERPLWSFEVESSYVGRMRTVAGQGPIPDRLATDSRMLVNLTGQYRLTEDGTRLFVSVQNLTDNEYIAARNPSGARPGLARTVMAGIRFSLGQ